VPRVSLHVKEARGAPVTALIGMLKVFLALLTLSASRVEHEFESEVPYVQAQRITGTTLAAASSASLNPTPGSCASVGPASHPA
jgi:hypothetical protein